MPKKETVVIPASWGGRDAGKTFVITEMYALDAERWGNRLVVAVKGTTGYIPDELAQYGMVAIALRGINALLSSAFKFEDVEPLLDEMLTCISVIRDPRYPDIQTPLTKTDIEEVRTVGWLRSEVLRVHTGFSFADALSILHSMGTAPASQNT